ncbi:MAG: primosomal protein N' [Betaproteobacteria bacterium]|nr:primosomal protein N' [Betaproteobacteria bacterium]
MTFIEVALDLPLNTLFDYQCDEATLEDIGLRVVVPFGRDEKVGIVVAVKENTQVPPQKIKQAIQLWRDVPPITDEVLQLLRFTSQYYHYPLGPVIMHALPPALKKTAGWQPPKKRSKAIAVKPLSAPPLNPAQRSAVESIDQKHNEFKAWLLQGITGSGKTEVYLELVERTLQRGKKVLIMVPEINLTPLVEQRFQARFPQASMVSLHSALGDKERAQRWIEIAEGKVDIVLGTRLSIFAPLEQLGLIVVDEEHDSSYKQAEGMRYNARDLALVRGQNKKIPVVLGSASPSLESWWNAKQQRYQHIHLLERAHPGATLPAIHLIKASQEESKPVSDRLIHAIGERLDKAQQSMVFINRRGFAPVLICNQCQWLATCEHCQTRLVVHRRQRQLRCHHCDYQRPLDQYCRHCKSHDLTTLGEGTQKIEEFLQQRFPDARILRIDSDSLKSREWATQIQEISQGQVDILVGTQILIKGHDFPKLTMVAAVNVDSALYSSDFRASERLFTQLLQASGRAGRGADQGEVFIETAFPQHPLFQALIEHDYQRFAENEINERRLIGFPPFCYQAILRASSTQLSTLQSFMHSAKHSLKALHAEHLTLFDVIAPTLAKVGHKHRLQLLIQSSSRSHLQQALSLWSTELYPLSPSGVNWVIDVDPIDC